MLTLLCLVLLDGPERPSYGLLGGGLATQLFQCLVDLFAFAAACQTQGSHVDFFVLFTMRTNFQRFRALSGRLS